MSDEKLIEQTLSGDQNAFGVLVERYQDRLYNIVYHIVNDYEDARDVVQEAFLQAFANLDRFRGSSRFYTWIYRISFNIAVGHLRQRKRTISMEKILEERGEFFADKGDSPEMLSTREEDAKILWDGINRLPVEYRSPLILREIEGASYDDIAEMLDVPVGTIRSRLHRARIALKEIIERQKDSL